jgi:transposase
MSKSKEFIGIDISKETFDVVLLQQGKEPTHEVFENSVPGCKRFLKWLSKRNVDSQNCLVCAEHTGMYVNIVAAVLTKNNVPLWLEMSYRIIRSSGIQRGKSDKIDALRIAQYAERHQDQAVLYTPKDAVITKISSLLKLRDKLVRSKASLLRTVNEYKSFDKEVARILAENQRRTTKAMEKDIAAVDHQIDNLIKSDESYAKLFNQVSSVSGVGKVTALTLICYTNAFTSFENPRQLACYCGVVPFEHTSGKSVKGRPRVHYMANKNLKQLLHMCALSASRNDIELHSYYTRKVSEGKSKMLVLNNIRNKIVHRICACVREDRIFETRKVA